MAAELAKVYDPAAVEGDIYTQWLTGEYFRAPIIPGRRPFTVMIPPPNVTGALHMGHALDNTLQDILVRWHRMLGEPTLWLPGTDHAGLATQIKVEAVLKEETGQNRHDLGRHAFVERVWEWKAKYGNTIINQLKRLGASCDWSRERFTMDDGYSLAVRTVFVQLYERGLIYQGDRITNWCPTDQTALSDIEVERAETAGSLWHFRYPLADGSGHVEIATTRPETLPGDTAVAVHPADVRYRHWVGKQLRHPVTGMLIPIVADEAVEPEFGTGAVKVTPYHDMTDFEIAGRHQLPAPQVIGDDARMTAAAGKYAGMDRYECRRLIISDMEKAGVLVKVEDHTLNLGTCQRCGTVVEPLISKQWFVRMQPLVGPAVQAVQNGTVRIWPERFTGVYLHWLENIHDWCISRQIYWGHRIPIWYCGDCKNVMAVTDAAGPGRCRNCGSGNVQQDPDCLDTWFSSALWPFSTLGWPEETADLAYFYPTSVLVTGYDILFFWVARMIFSGLAFTGKVPFSHVLLHGLIRDSEGRKMSKSLGNGIDPLDMIDQYGADALRFMLATGTGPGHDLRFYIEKVEAAQKFANKLWNASRFVLMNLSDFVPEAVADLPASLRAHGETEDRWILTRLQTVAGAVQAQLERFELGQAAELIYNFIWDEFCDWYIELVKPRLYGKNGTPETRRLAQYTLWTTLDGLLKLLHPFMPFITEAIWQRLPRPAAGAANPMPALIVAPWPLPDPALSFPADVQRVDLWMDVIKAVRSLRADANVSPGAKVQVMLQCSDPGAAGILAGGRHHIMGLTRAAKVEIGPVVSEKPESATATVVSGVEVYLPLRDLIDVEKEVARVTQERDRAERELARSQGKLNNPDFMARAAAEAVAKEQTRALELRQRLAALDRRLELLTRR